MDFRSVVLDQPEIASMVFAFQCGLYEDVRQAIRACEELLEVDGSLVRYACDPAFCQTFAPNAEWSGNLVRIAHHDYALPAHSSHARVALHVAVAEGFAHLTKRILDCRPDIATEDAILLAFRKGRVEVAELLLDAREKVPQLYRRGIIRSGASPVMGHIFRSYWDNFLARDDSRGLLLVQRFGLPPKDVTQSIQHATLENATLALDLFPWFIYSDLLDDVAGRGFLPLVRSLHERGLKCSTVAMDKAAMNGHLDVVQFLHFNRTEGCTTKALDGAIANGHLDVVRFLSEHRIECCGSFP